MCTIHAKVFPCECEELLKGKLPQEITNLLTGNSKSYWTFHTQMMLNIIMNNYPHNSWAENNVYNLVMHTCNIIHKCNMIRAYGINNYAAEIWKI